jgi:signal transduction histidine kinase
MSALRQFVCSKVAVQFSVVSPPKPLSVTDHDPLTSHAGTTGGLVVVVIVVVDVATVVVLPSGGVVDMRLSVAPRQERPGALVEVADEGPGVAPDERAHIFERFYRSDRARQGEGAGLGLAIVKQAVDLHRGQIEVSRSSAGGAKFSLTFPQHQPAGA